MFDLLLFFLFFFSSDPSTTEIYTLSLHDALPIFNRNSTTHLVGVTDRENDVLLPFLLDHVRSPEFQCRFHWEPGSIAMWDNRAVQHYAVADYHERRVMRRVTIAGPPAR